MMNNLCSSVDLVSSPSIFFENTTKVLLPVLLDEKNKKHKNRSTIQPSSNITQYNRRNVLVFFYYDTRCIDGK